MYNDMENKLYSIRIGNDFTIGWRIHKGVEVVDLRDMVNLSLKSRIGSSVLDIPVNVLGNGTLRIDVTSAITPRTGLYNYMLRYENPMYQIGSANREQTIDRDAYIIVDRTAKADEISEFEMSSDLLLGLQGASAFDVWNIENGGNNTYDDWIDFLQAPATQIEGIVSANEAVRIENENTRKANEQTRQSIESARVTAEIDRESNEDTRSLNEAARLTNEDDRIENENQRVIDEGKREQFYDNTVILKGEVETLKTETETAKDSAISAATLANDKAALAQDKADYAESQGDYAKEKGDLVADVVENESERVQNEAERISKEGVRQSS